MQISPIVTLGKWQHEGWGIDQNGKDYLYQWKFLPLGLKNAHVEFQRVMDRVLTCLDYAKCYIDDIIMFNFSMELHGHHLQNVFEQLGAHGYLKWHPRKCRCFQSWMEYLDHTIYLGGLGMQKG
jgi:hypothetical protein